MSFFSEEDKAANRRVAESQAAIAREQRRKAPRVASNLVDLLEAAARQMFRDGHDVTQIEVTDGPGESNSVIQEILEDALIPLVEQRFGRDRSAFTLRLYRWNDFEDLECMFKGNTVNITFNEPLN